MRCVTDPDVRVFAGHALPWLLREPVRHNVLATTVQGRLEKGSGSAPGAAWVRVLDAQERLAAVAVRTPASPLLLSVMTPSPAQALADDFADGSVDGSAQRLPGVDGPADAALAFMARYRERTGARVLPGLGTRMYRLNRPVPPAGVPGQLREARADDRALIVRWMNWFTAEAQPHQQPSDPTPSIDDRLTRGRMLWLWEDRGAPVSFLWLSPPAAGVVRISAVYTPFGVRRRGYATACVAAVGQHVLDAGASGCMLYADTANPTSNAIYLRIGFQPVEDAQEWLFSYW
jgi:predicted GNAT family acetyltransferase